MLILSLVAGVAACPPAAVLAIAASIPPVTPRVVGPAELEALRIYDPHLDQLRFRVDEPDGEDEEDRFGFNESDEYRMPLWESLTSQPTPVDGAQAAQSVYAYQPRLAVSFSVRDSGSLVPADCTIAAGPSHVVVAFNSFLAFYTKTGERTYISSLDGLLGATSGWKGHFDPKVVYDEGSGRFFLMALDYNLTARQASWAVAVSITSNPHQGWYVYDVRNELDGEGIDYEELGFGPRGVYLCGNYISFPEWASLPPPSGAHNNALWVFDKAAMVAGQTVSGNTFNDVAGEGNQAVFVPKVALVHTQPFGAVDGFMTAFQGMTNPPNTLRISVWGISLPGNFPTGAATLARQTVDVAMPAATPNAQQSGGPARLQANNFGVAPLNLQFRGNTLTLAAAAGSGSLAVAKVIQLSVVWPSVTLTWQTDFSDGTNYHFWPQVAVNARGQSGLVYCHSGTSLFARSRWTTRTADDPGFLSSQLLREGDAYVGNALTDNASTLYRWGDYSGAAVDPVSQGFWFFAMYGADRGSNNNTDFRLWAGFVPRAVYVDGTWGGSEFGTTQRPWNTFGEAITDAFNGNDVVIKGGSYSSPGLLTKPMTVFADGGTVILQVP